METADDEDGFLLVQVHLAPQRDMQAKCYLQGSSDAWAGLPGVALHPLSRRHYALRELGGAPSSCGKLQGPETFRGSPGTRKRSPQGTKKHGITLSGLPKSKNSCVWNPENMSKGNLASTAGVTWTEHMVPTGGALLGAPIPSHFSLRERDR